MGSNLTKEQEEKSPQSEGSPAFEGLAAPKGCSAEYQEGWGAAEEWIRYGGPLDERDLDPRVMPGGMSVEQAAGFRARILKTLHPDNGQVLAFRPRAARA